MFCTLVRPTLFLLYNRYIWLLIFFFFNDTATTEIYTLSLTTLFRSPYSAKLFSTLCNAQSRAYPARGRSRSEEHTSELQSHLNLVCRLLLEKKKQHKQARQADHAMNTNLGN